MEEAIEKAALFTRVRGGGGEGRGEGEEKEVEYYKFIKI